MSWLSRHLGKLNIVPVVWTEPSSAPVTAMGLLALQAIAVRKCMRAEEPSPTVRCDHCFHHKCIIQWQPNTKISKLQEYGTNRGWLEQHFVVGNERVVVYVHLVERQLRGAQRLSGVGLSWLHGDRGPPTNCDGGFPGRVLVG